MTTKISLRNPFIVAVETRIIQLLDHCLGLVWMQSSGETSSIYHMANICGIPFDEFDLGLNKLSLVKYDGRFKYDQWESIFYCLEIKFYDFKPRAADQDKKQNNTMWVCFSGFKHTPTNRSSRSSSQLNEVTVLNF